MRSIRRVLIAGCVLLAPPVWAGALPDADLSPLIVTTGLANAEESAWLLQRGQAEWHWSVATASHSSQRSAGQEILQFDGETTRLSLKAEFGVTDRLSLGMELPYLLHESGGLDSAIERWHSWFGFPNNFRDLVAQDQIDFRYSDNGSLLLDNQQNLRGVGDLRLLAGWQLNRSENSASALRVALKLPTGSSERLTGSGNVDLAIGYVNDRNRLFGSERWSSFYRLYAILVGEPDRLTERAKPLIGQAAAGLSVQALPRLSLTMQATIRSAAYDSDLRMLGDPAVLLNVGGMLRLSEHLQLAINVGEDIRVDTAPDVTFGLSLKYLPRASR
ncbi:MAG: DUF3187 family protein [Woeseia sp.]